MNAFSGGRYQKDFDVAQKSIEKGTSRLQTQAQAVNARFLYESQNNVLGFTQEASGRIAMSGRRQQVKVPFNNIPFPRNPWFSGRDALLSQVESILLGSNELELRCCALWGTAGIGKTQSALKYALSRRDLAASGDNTAEQVIIWVKCESALQTAQSLRGIAASLHLVDDTKDTDAEKCRILLLGWLAATGTSIITLRIPNQSHK